MIKPPWEQDRYQGEGKVKHKVNLTTRQQALIESFDNADYETKIKRVKWGMSLFRFFIFLGLFSSAVFVYEGLKDDSLPALSDLEIKRGEIVAVYNTAARVSVPTMVLQTDSGVKIKYRYSYENKEMLKQLIGKKVTVWGERKFWFFDLIEQESSYYQLEHDGKLIRDYAKHAEAWKRFRDKPNYVAWVFVIFVSIVVTIPGIICYRKAKKQLKKVRDEHSQVG